MIPAQRSARLILRRAALFCLTLTFVSCTSDSPGGSIDGGTGPTNPLTQRILSISPAGATIGTGDTVRLVAWLHLGSTDSMADRTDWFASGGSIDTTGLFTSDSAGVYSVRAASRTQQGLADSVLVSVHAPRAGPTLTVNPGAVVLDTGRTVQFTGSVLGVDSNVSQSLAWTATGGLVGTDGSYRAGSSSGSFIVVATCACGLADTAHVVIQLPAGATTRLDGARAEPRQRECGGGRPSAVHRLGTVERWIDHPARRDIYRNRRNDFFHWPLHRWGGARHLPRGRKSGRRTPGRHLGCHHSGTRTAADADHTNPGQRCASALARHGSSRPSGPGVMVRRHQHPSATPGRGGLLPPRVFTRLEAHPVRTA